MRVDTLRPGEKFICVLLAAGAGFQMLLDLLAPGEVQLLVVIGSDFSRVKMHVTPPFL
jgi:hypothetical protein